MIFTDRLAVKVLMAFVVVLIPIGIGGYTGYVENRKAMTGHILEDLTLVAEAYEGNLYSFLELAAKHRAEDFASDGLIRDTLEEILGGDTSRVAVLNAYLVEHKMPLDPTIVGISIIDNRGTVVASTMEVEIGKDEAEDIYFAEGLKGSYISDAYLEEPFSREPLMAVSTPITSRKTGETLGVLVNYIRLAELNAILSGELQRSLGALTGERGRAETLEVYIVNRDGYMITDSRFVDAASLTVKVDTPPVVACREGREISGTYENYLGTRVLGASMCLPDRGWTLLVEMSEEEALLPLLPLRQRVFIIGMTEIGLLLLLLFFYWRAVITPVLQLSKAARRVASGDLTVRVEVRTKDELGKLAGDFNRMVEGLETSHARIKEARDHLESVILSTRDAMLVMDREFTITDANPAALELAGLTKEEMIGRKCHKVSHNQDAPCQGIPCPVREVFETGEAMKMVHEHFDKDGKVHIVDITASPIKDEDGNVVALVEVARDITEKHLAELQIRDTVAKLQTLLETGTALASSLNYGEILRIVAEKTGKISGVRFASIFVAEGDVLRIAEGYNLPEEYKKEVTVPMGEGPTGKAYRDKKPYWVEDVFKEDIFAPWRDVAKRQGYSAIASIPLISRSEVIGVLCLYFENPRTFTQEDIDLYMTIAAQATVAIENARLLEESRRKSEELEARLHELERMHRAFVGRELKMKELKEECRRLRQMQERREKG